MYQLIKEAVEKYGKITMCDGCKTPAECFRVDDGMLIFYFNDKNDSTHILRRKLK